MSRNDRHKSNVTPAKKRSKRAATYDIDNSSSDDYEGVDDITDSDEEEKDVEEAESRALIDEISDEDLQTTPRPSQDMDEMSNADSRDDQASWNGFEEYGDQPFFNAEMARAPDANLFQDATTLSESEPDTRRVRFAVADDLSDSSSNASDDSDHGFPDLFVGLNDLDPTFRREVENDADEDIGSSDWSMYDFERPGGSSHQIERQVEDDSDETSDSTSGNDESDISSKQLVFLNFIILTILADDGETTEEEDLPERRYVPARSVLRQPVNESTSDEEEIVIRRTSPKTPRLHNSRNAPRLGIWSHTPERPYAMFDSSRKRMRLVKAQIQRRYSFADAPLFLPKINGDILPPQEMSPMISNSANLMMSAMYNEVENMQLFGGNVLGPPEAFFPFTNIDANGHISQDSPDSFDEDDIEDAELQLLAMDDLIAFPDDDDDDEDELPTDGEMTTPRPTTVNSEDQVHPLLMSRGLVGAFRNNQNNHRILSSSNVSQNSLLFSGRFNSTAIQGIREGHINAAGAPITPLRKQRRVPMDSSPLATLTSKRKSDSDHRGHKRYKSMH